MFTVLDLLSCVNFLKKREPVSFMESGTEATNPKVLPSRKRKRRTEDWQINVKKNKYNLGKGYEMVGKKKTKLFKPEKADQ